MHRMLGDLSVLDNTILRAGFMPNHLSPAGGNFELGPSIPLYTRGCGLKPEHEQFVQTLQRGEFTGDLAQISQQLGMTLSEIVRATLTSTTSAFPVRENLEAEAKVLVPTDTPVRNMLPRRMGSGLSSAWRQATSLGGGWGTSLDQPGGGTATRMFFGESGAPAEHVTAYASKSATYKLLGTYGAVTGLAMAGGANFQNQLATEKAHALRNLMLNEEYSLISGDSSSTAAPWGDGSTALAYDGLLNLVTVANGTPSAQVQTSVGALTLSHVDNQLKRLADQGGQSQYMIMNGQEILSLVHLAEASGSIIRVQASAQADSILGVAVTGYKHPITGEIVPILYSRFMPAGTILFGSKFLPDGTPGADVDVLPQVQLPTLAPNENIMGYTAQELAPTTAAPHVYPSSFAGGTIH